MYMGRGYSPTAEKSIAHRFLECIMPPEWLSWHGQHTEMPETKGARYGGSNDSMEPPQRPVEPS